MIALIAVVLALLPMSQPPSQTKIRIVAMGDSTTAGTPAFKSPRETPPKGSGDETSQYAYWLMKAHPGWEVVNLGPNTPLASFRAALVHLRPRLLWLSISHLDDATSFLER